MRSPELPDSDMLKTVVGLRRSPTGESVLAGKTLATPFNEAKKRVPLECFSRWDRTGHEQLAMTCYRTDRSPFLVLGALHYKILWYPHNQHLRVNQQTAGGTFHFAAHPIQSAG